MRLLPVLVVIPLTFASMAMASSVPRPGPSQVTQVTVGLDGAEPDRGSWSASMSGDGRYVAFVSAATNLVPGDTNGQADIFVRDHLLGTTTRVSVSSRGVQSNGESRFPALSGDGRYVVFDSGATNLVPRDTNGAYDVFRHDLRTGRTVRVSVAADGGQAAQGAVFPDVSADGQQIVFESGSPDLVPDDTNGGGRDVFLKNMRTGQVEVASLDADGRQPTYGGQAPAISADGNRVAFTGSEGWAPGSSPAGFVDRVIYLRDRARGSTIAVSGELSDTRFILTGSGSQKLSADGRYVVFTYTRSYAIGGEAVNHTYRKDTLTGDLRLVSADRHGRLDLQLGSLAQDVSADGRYVLYLSQLDTVPGDTDGLADVYLKDMQGGLTRRLTQGLGFPSSIAISDDGLHIAYEDPSRAAIFRVDRL